MEIQSLNTAINNILDNLFSSYVENVNSISNLYDHIVCSVEYVLICRVLQETSFNKTAAAQVLGISRTTLSNKIAKYNILTDE